MWSLFLMHTRLQGGEKRIAGQVHRTPAKVTISFYDHMKLNGNQIQSCLVTVCQS